MEVVTNTKERIQAQATEMFMRYGIRSVSMDDIALHAGISKKTIYQYFRDKDELVEAVVDLDIRQIKDDCGYCSDHAKNAIDELFLTMKRIVEQFRNLNPVLLYDLQKFHFRSYQKFMDHKNKYLLDVIRRNLERGIEEGLYRPELNVDIISRFRIESMMVVFNIDLFPPTRYNLWEVSQEIIELYTYGLVNLKGYELILKYKEAQSKKTNDHDKKDEKA